jgi:hypothetical protein
VIELPPGPYIGLIDDHYQRWVLDMGLPGPDAGKGGKRVVLPPRLPRGHPVRLSRWLFELDEEPAGCAGSPSRWRRSGSHGRASRHKGVSADESGQALALR